MNKLKPYTKRVGALILTVEPMWKAGHGEYPNTWVARVDMDVPEYDTTANIACTHFGRLNPAVARAIAINRGHAMLVNHIIARASVARKAMQ